MLVISSPSGAGKSTLARDLLSKDPAITLSVSVTTRPPREGEVDGTDYHFISHDQFAGLRDSDDLLEWAEVFGNYYGTPRAAVEEALSNGRDVLFDIDWQGTQQLAEKAAKDLVRIFILPPSTEELERRLRSRAQDPEDVVLSRMAKSADEVSHWAEYDYIVVNYDVAESLAQVQAILTAERLKRERQIGLHEFVERFRRPR